MYHTSFKKISEAAIGIEELKFINNDDINELFPGFKYIGIKAKFRQKLRDWRKQNVSNILSMLPIGQLAKNKFVKILIYMYM